MGKFTHKEFDRQEDIRLSLSLLHHARSNASIQRHVEIAGFHVWMDDISRQMLTMMFDYIEKTLTERFFQAGGHNTWDNFPNDPDRDK